MERFMIRRWVLILPGGGGAPRTLANQRSASGVGLSTRYGTLSNLGTTVSSLTRRRVVKV